MHEEHINTEQTIIASIKSHKVRLDVLFSDSNAWYDIEMQVRNEDNLPKRTRYAHSIIDVDYLKAGQSYNNLKPSYVIFLCCFDFFKLDKPIYCFRMLEEDNYLPLGDETYTLILNSKADKTESTSKALLELFEYMNKAIVAEGNEFLKQIDQSVESWNIGEGRHMIMTLEQEIMIIEARAREGGEKRGEKKGTLNTLVGLVSDGLISTAEGAKRADMDIEEFKEAVEKYQKRKETLT